MNFGKFSLATITGSALWCSVLAYLGAKAYQVQARPDLQCGWLVDLHQSPFALDRYLSSRSWRFSISWSCG